MKGLRERALAALEESRRERAEYEAEREVRERQDRAERLARAVERVLGVQVGAADETVTVDGLQFTIYDSPFGSSHLRLVERCPECGTVYTRGPVYSLASLGELLQSPSQCPNPIHRPPAKHMRTVFVEQVEIIRGAGYQPKQLQDQVNRFLEEITFQGATRIRLHLSESTNSEGSNLTVMVVYRAPRTVEVTEEAVE